jgi:hypothetical protein
MAKYKFCPDVTFAGGLEYIDDNAVLMVLCGKKAADDSPPLTYAAATGAYNGTTQFALGEVAIDETDMAIGDGWWPWVDRRCPGGCRGGQLR